MYQLIEEYKRLKKAVTQIGNVNLGGKGNDMQQLMRNPGQIASKMNQMMDPRMISQLGGMDNIMDMMKNFSKQEGFGNRLVSTVHAFGFGVSSIEGVCSSTQPKTPVTFKLTLFLLRYQNE